MKKFFKISSVLVAIIFVFSCLTFVSCKGNELEKISKNLTSYAIVASLNDEKMSIDADQKVNYLNESEDALDFICFHLYARAFREGAMVKPYTSLNEAACFPAGVSYGDIHIEEVSVDGDKAEFELVGTDEDILKVNFKSSLKQKDRVNIDIKFELILPNSTHRLGYQFPIFIFFS